MLLQSTIDVTSSTANLVKAIKVTSLQSTIDVTSSTANLVKAISYELDLSGHISYEIKIMFLYSPKCYFD